MVQPPGHVDDIVVAAVLLFYSSTKTRVVHEACIWPHA
jgi:hypothetical protein